MKYLFASDVHGSAYWCRQLMRAIEVERPKGVVLLGDLLYHGPRNPLPKDYNPRAVADMLNALSPAPLAVRGNCDSEVDQMMLLFPCMSDYSLLEIADEKGASRRMFLTHGHVVSPDDAPALGAGDVFASGHTHIKRLEIVDDVVFFNPGSVSLPKDEIHSFGVYEDGKLELKELPG